MRVLYYHQHFSTPEGSTGTRSYEMARRLVLRGHEVTMVCGSYGMGRTGLSGDYRRGRRQGVVDGIRVIEYELPYSNKDSFLRRSYTFLRFAFRSIGLALTSKYDVVFATSTPLTAGLPGIVARFVRFKPFVFEVRDLWPELPRAMGVITNPVILKLLSWLEWISYRSAVACVGLSPGIVEGIRLRAGRGKQVEMIPNGCDLEMFGRDTIETIELRGVEKDDLVAAFIGAHGIANGLDAVLEAALELKSRGRKDIKLFFVGDGMKKKELMRRVSHDGLDNCVFLDPVPKRDLKTIMTRVDVGMMILANVPAFYYGTSPNKFFDYITAGLPVINNYPGWLAEMINHHNCGHAVPPEDPQAFADALEMMADHRGSLVEMGENARKLAEKEFDRRKLAEHFVDLLESVAVK